MEMPDTAPPATPKEPPIILRDVPEKIVGERIVIRPFQPDDAQAIFEAIYESRDHLYPWLPFATPDYNLQEAQVFARRAQARWILREDMPVGIWRREDGRYLGGTGLHRIDWSVPHFEIGYWLRRSEEGNGYMTEAVTLLCKMCFETLGANRVEIRCDAQNARSAAVPRRLGFVQEAILRNDTRDHTGKLRDTFIFGMTPDDYTRQFRSQS
jgi:ribosomal-protein-serine acetyltransferase